jgi:hypothetical protein
MLVRIPKAVHGNWRRTSEHKNMRLDISSEDYISWESG